MNVRTLGPPQRRRLTSNRAGEGAAELGLDAVAVRDLAVLGAAELGLDVAVLGAAELNGAGKGGQGADEPGGGQGEDEGDGSGHVHCTGDADRGPRMGLDPATRAAKARTRAMVAVMFTVPPLARAPLVPVGAGRCLHFRAENRRDR
jgi:hypothetical protein